MSRITLLGIPIDALTRMKAVERLHTMLASGKAHHVMTPNSEMLVASQKDSHFRQVLERSDLNLPDSQGIVWMASYTGQVVPERVTGVDTVMAFCATLTEADSVFFLGAAPGVASIAAVALANRNPHLKIAGTFSGSPSDGDAAGIIEQINAVQPHILFVAYGAPAQDIWIANHLKDLPSVRIAMGVGGTFDFLAGVKKRAPFIMQRLGCEWLWRLVQEPRRFPRIFNAVLVFPWLVIRSQWTGPRAANR
jgi:N-acetylglucosaminyldiphosphoundecaprenol N-acetyl-beta-D-mannosaminyltransferase